MWSVAIESLNRSLREVLKTKGCFPNEESIYKLLYLALNNIAKKWNCQKVDDADPRLESSTHAFCH
jgi:transposase-like protein